MAPRYCKPAYFYMSFHGGIFSCFLQKFIPRYTTKIQATPAMSTSRYLDTTTYVKVIFHSQHFFSIFLCISTPSMSKTVNMKQWVSQGDFSCLRRIFYYIAAVYVEVKIGARFCFSCVHVLAEVPTSSKQQ